MSLKFSVKFKVLEAMTSVIEDHQEDNFKPVFKYYKSRQPPPNLGCVVDTHKGNYLITGII